MAFSQNPEQGEAQSVRPELSPWLESAGKTPWTGTLQKKLTFLRVRDLLKKEEQIDIFTINYSILGIILKAMKWIISLEI